MNIVVVDNHWEALNKTKVLLQGLFPYCSVKTFEDPFMSAKYICNNPVDVAILECDMRPVDGVALLKVIKTHTPMVAVVLVTKECKLYQESNLEKGVSYICRPLTAEKLHKLNISKGGYQ